tara:strand:- start:783 stop:1028 length:246 start_codon:yes stop_codon:yes gene_type:complete
MKKAPFKLKGFSGFGNSPMKQEKVDTKTKTRKNILTGNRTVIETQEVEGVKRKVKTTYDKDGNIVKQVVVKKGGGEIKLRS